MSKEPYHELINLGLGKRYAELLKATGVASVPELAERHPENLHLCLVVTNEEKNWCANCQPCQKSRRGWNKPEIL